IVERATAAGARVAPEAHRDADHVVAGLDQQRRSNRAIDSAAHAYDDAITGARFSHASISAALAERMRCTACAVAATTPSICAGVFVNPRLKRIRSRAASAS